MFTKANTRNKSINHCVLEVITGAVTVLHWYAQFQRTQHVDACGTKLAFVKVSVNLLLKPIGGIR